MEHAIAQHEAIIPELLRVLADARSHLDDLPDSDDMAYIFAMYLLAQFREPRAYSLIVDFFSVPGDVAMDATGDVATEDLGRILASVSCGDISLMTALVENPQVNEYVRTAALRGLVTLVACGERSRDEIMAYFQAPGQGTRPRCVTPGSPLPPYYRHDQRDGMVGKFSTSGPHSPDRRGRTILSEKADPEIEGQAQTEIGEGSPAEESPVNRTWGTCRPPAYAAVLVLVIRAILPGGLSTVSVRIEIQPPYALRHTRATFGCTTS
jgi:hypothetical protein